MISEDAQNKIDSILRQTGSDSMTQDDIEYANALGVSPETNCDCYKLAQNVLIERVSIDSTQSDTLSRLNKLAVAEGCLLAEKKPEIHMARIIVIGGELS